jgi:anti-anti-sigma factor
VGYIEVTDEAGIAVVTLLGEHDVATAESVGAAIEGLLDSDRRVVVDLTQADFIDSTVVAGVLAGHRRVIAEGREHAIAAAITPGSRPERTWKLLGLNVRVPTFTTRPDAVAAMKDDDANDAALGA